MTQWSEDETFWEAMEPALCAPGRLALAATDVPAILTMVEARPNSRVLDLGCGPGAHAICFARQGHRVTGVDASPRLLNRARSSAEAQGVQVQWVEADMRAFQKPSSFDLVCSLYTSFGYFDDAARRLTMSLRGGLSSLAGGPLIGDYLRERAGRPTKE